MLSSLLSENELDMGKYITAEEVLCKVDDARPGIGKTGRHVVCGKRVQGRSGRRHI